MLDVFAVCVPEQFIGCVKGPLRIQLPPILMHCFSGRTNVSRRRRDVRVVLVHPVAILSSAFCVIYGSVPGCNWC